MKTQKLAAIDIGSNSLKLVIIEAAATTHLPCCCKTANASGLDTKRSETIFVGRGDQSFGKCHRQNFAPLPTAAKLIRSLPSLPLPCAKRKTPPNSSAKLKNAPAFTSKFYSSLEEARLIGVAVAQFFDAKQESLLNIDIGGGSTELSLMKKGQPDKLFSMKLGAVGLTEKFIFSNPPKPKEIKNLQAEIIFRAQTANAENGGRNVAVLYRNIRHDSQSRRAAQHRNARKQGNTA